MIDVTVEFGAVCKAYVRLQSVLKWPDSKLLGPVVDVSEWSAGQQICHIAQVNTLITRRIVELATDPEDRDADRRASILGISVLASGYIPRGGGQAPARLHPPRDLSRTFLDDTVSQSVKLLEEVESLLGLLQTRRSRIEHPYFGYFRPTQWIRFMNVHTSHHLKIVRDIERAQEAKHGPSMTQKS